jgi:preprotein translocase subunit YajC
MFENLIIVAIIAMVLWMGSYAYYTYTSKQQQQLEEDIHSLEKILNGDVNAEKESGQ